MSLVRSALRMTLVEALTDRTMAGGNVRDSMIAPLNDADDNQTPEIVVTTDDIEFEPNAALLSGRGALEITCSTAVTQRMDPSDAPEGYRSNIPLTDAGLEFALDILSRQIQAALADPENPWADAMMGLCVSKPTLVAERRGAARRDGLRFAGRELVLRVQPIADPYPGRPLSAPWTRVLSMAASANDDLQAWAAHMSAAIEGHQPEANAALAAALEFAPAADRDALLTSMVALTEAQLGPAAPKT